MHVFTEYPRCRYAFTHYVVRTIKCFSSTGDSVHIVKIQHFKVSTREVVWNLKVIYGNRTLRTLGSAFQVLESIKTCGDNLKVVTILLQNIQRLCLKFNIRAAFLPRILLLMNWFKTAALKPRLISKPLIFR